MNAPTKLLAFVAVLALVLGGAFLIGTAVDPEDPPEQVAEHGTEHATPSAASDDHEGSRPTTTSGSAAPATPDGHGQHDDAGDAPPSGLAVSEHGYALELDRTHVPASDRAPLRLRIVDERGRTVRDAFEVSHEKRLHLVVVRRDTGVFRHVHPEQRADGSWTVDVDLAAPGVYRAFADFKIDGAQHTLATDVFVPGAFRPRDLPAPQRTVRAVDEDDTPTPLDVTLDAPTIRAGRAATLRFSVTEDGRPVDRLEPYLGAKGHLVALREGDLAYLHVHPVGDAGDGASHDESAGDDAGREHDDAGSAPHEHAPAADGDADARSSTTFAATFPTAGRYRLFLQFRVDGRIRTADYTVEVQR